MFKRCVLTVLCMLLCLICLTLGEEAGTRLEFEDGELLGGAAVNKGWVEGFKRRGDGVQLVFEAPEDGEYEITIYSASQSGRLQNDLLLDGEKIGTLISKGSDFTSAVFSNVYMTRGTHLLSVMHDYGWIRLDAAIISKTPALNPGVYDVEPTLSNPDASEEARALMAWLCENYGAKMISGQYLDEGQYGREIGAIGEVTGGLYPALLGLDMMNYSPSSVKLGSWPTSVDQAIEYWKQGYILTFCWHWVAPEKYLDTSGNNWWGGFYTQNTTFDLKKAINGEDPEGYELLLRDMDAIAQQLLRLKDAGVPVIWRPLHEASGGWFWWGAGGRDAYKQLYRLMYDKFTNEYGLNNLIWIWNGQSALWYPGDDVVDIIGEDLYPGNHIHSSQAQAFTKCLSYTQAKKLIMLSECGCVPSPAACKEDGEMWSAWATWCYEFVLDQGAYSEQYTSAEKLNEFYNNENVITLRDVPAFGRETLSVQETSSPAGVIQVEFEGGALSGQTSLAGIGGDKWVEMRGNGENDSVCVTFEIANEDVYDLALIQAGIGGYKENYLLIDGVQQETNAVINGEDWEECSLGSVWLDAGEHTVQIKAFWGWVKLDRLILTPQNPPASEMKAEFEDGVLSGNVTLGALGADRWVELKSNDENDSVTVTLSVPEDGVYDLIFYEAGIGGYKENYLCVDGEQLANTVVNGTAWEECVTEDVYLTAGEHEIKISCFWGWCKLDWVKVVKAE